TEHERVKLERLRIPFPMTGDLNWRALLVTYRGAPMYLSLTFSHLIVDVWSIHHLQDQFKELVAGGGAAVETGFTPRRLARRQRAADWRPRQEASERYWRDVFAAGLMDRLPTLPAKVEKE